MVGLLLFGDVMPILWQAASDVNKQKAYHDLQILSVLNMMIFGAVMAPFASISLFINGKGGQPVVNLVVFYLLLYSTIYSVTLIMVGIVGRWQIVNFLPQIAPPNSTRHRLTTCLTCWWNLW